MPRAPVGMSVGGETAAAAGLTTKTPGCWTALPPRAAGQTPSHVRRQGSQMPLEHRYQPAGHTSRGSSRAGSSCCPSPRRNERTLPPGVGRGCTGTAAPTPASLAQSRTDASGTRLPLQAPLWTCAGSRGGAEPGDCRTCRHCPEGPSPASGLHGLSLHHLTLAEGADCLGTFLRTGRASNGHASRTSPEGGRGSAQGPLRTTGSGLFLG